jgi:hypothetical protein
MVSAESLCGDEIYNTLEKYEGHVDSNMEIVAIFDNSDSGLRHFDDTPLGNITVSETDVREDERNENFLWKNTDNYVGQKGAFYNV